MAALPGVGNRVVGEPVYRGDVAAKTSLQGKLMSARMRRREREYAQRRERKATVLFMDAALADGWTWGQIGEAVGISAVAARRYYGRNVEGEKNVHRDRRGRRGGGDASRRDLAAGTDAAPARPAPRVHTDRPASEQLQEPVGS
jgi:hypothetical protein